MAPEELPRLQLHPLRENSGTTAASRAGRASLEPTRACRRPAACPAPRGCPVVSGRAACGDRLALSGCPVLIFVMGSPAVRIAGSPSSRAASAERSHDQANRQCAKTGDPRRELPLSLSLQFRTRLPAVAHRHERPLPWAKSFLTCSAISRRSTTGAPSGPALKKLNLADDWPAELILARPGRWDPEFVEWLLSTGPVVSRSCTLDAVMVTANSIASVPTASLRLRPLTFLAGSNPVLPPWAPSRASLACFRPRSGWPPRARHLSGLSNRSFQNRRVDPEGETSRRRPQEPS